MVQENYLSLGGHQLRGGGRGGGVALHHLRSLSEAVLSIADGDLIDARMSAECHQAGQVRAVDRAHFGAHQLSKHVMGTVTTDDVALDLLETPTARDAEAVR